MYKANYFSESKHNIMFTFTQTPTGFYCGAKYYYFFSHRIQNVFIKMILKFSTNICKMCLKFLLSNLYPKVLNIKMCHIQYVLEYKY